MAIRVGLVGLDHWYSALPLADGVIRNPDTDLVALWDANGRHAAEVAGTRGIDRIEDDWHAIVDDPEIDVILSFASVDTNGAICLAAAQNGKHVISNKPIARSLEEATKIADAVKTAGVHLFPGEARQRLGPRNRALRAWTKNGDVGRLCSATMAIWAGIPRQWADDDDPGWFVDPARTVGGAWVDHSIYQIDILRWILGEEVTTVVGTTANVLHHDLELEDYGVASLTFSGGLVATLENTWIAPTGGFQSSSRLVAERGAFDLNGITDRQLVIGSGLLDAGWAESRQPPPHDQGADIDHFVEVVRGEAAPIATVDDAVANLKVCLAFYESARAGERISLAP